jgi:hypothetical protein
MPRPYDHTANAVGAGHGRPALGLRNKPKLSKNTGQGPGRQGAERKNDKTNPIGTQLQLNQRAGDLVNRWTSSLRRAEA